MPTIAQKQCIVGLARIGVVGEWERCVMDQVRTTEDSSTEAAHLASAWIVQGSARGFTWQRKYRKSTSRATVLVAGSLGDVYGFTAILPYLSRFLWINHLLTFCIEELASFSYCSWVFGARHWHTCQRRRGSFGRCHGIGRLIDVRSSALA